MSVPSSLRVGPFVPTILPKRKYILFYIFLIWLSIIPIILQFWFYWRFLGDVNTPWEDRRMTHFYIFLPLVLLFWYIELVLLSLFFSRIMLSIVNTIRKPREGVFLRDKSDAVEYKYFRDANIINIKLESE